MMRSTAGQAEQQALKGLLVVLIFGGLMFLTQFSFDSAANDEAVTSNLRRSWVDWQFGKRDTDPSFNWNHEELSYGMVRRQQLLQFHTPQVTVVTAWFPPEGASRGEEAASARKWLSTFFGLRANIYVFTSPQQLNRLQTARLTACALCRTHWNTDYTSPLQFPIFNDEAGLLISPADWQAQLELQAGSEHSFALGLGKVWMMKHVADHNPFRTQYFHWQDIDSFSSVDPAASDLLQLPWPDGQQLEAIARLMNSQGASRIWTPLVSPLPRPPSPPTLAAAAQLRRNVLVGSSFFGEVEAIGWLYNQLRKTIYKYSDQSWAREQDILLYLAWTEPGRFLFLKVFNLDFSCGNPWFFHPLYLSESRSQCPAKNFLLEEMNSFGENCFEIRISTD